MQALINSVGLITPRFDGHIIDKKGEGNRIADHLSRVEGVINHVPITNLSMEKTSLLLK